MKMHLTDGEIRGYIDKEIAEKDEQRLRSHLGTCGRCQARAENLSTQGQRIDRSMAVLDPNQDESPPSASIAFSRFDKKYSSKENTNMLNRIFNRGNRFAWVALGVVAILAVAFAFPQVRAIGSSFLGLFRVQQFTVFQIDPGELEEQLSSASQFEYLLAEDVQVEEFGEHQEVADAAQASSLAGFQVRLPTAFESEGKLVVQPGAKVSYQIDLPKVQTVLNEIGGSEFKLPSELDGANVSMTIPVAVSAAFGDCEIPEEMMAERNIDPDMPLPDISLCTTLIQAPSPEISAPPGLDIAGIGEMLLQILGMSPEEAAQFSRSVDWTTTLIIPIPRYGTEYQDVFVDGVQGTIIMQSMRSELPQYLLIWIKDDIVYALAGPGDTASALEIAESLE
jgi:anti-sigma factor RsiW